MCGIVGVLSASAIAPRAVERMRDELAHRGPDHAGLWRSDDGRVCLGHRRLSIIDLDARSNQPMRRRRPLRHHLQRRDLQLPRAARASSSGAGRRVPHRVRHRGAARGLRAAGATAALDRLQRHVRVRDLGRARAAAVVRTRSCRREAVLLCGVDGMFAVRVGDKGTPRVARAAAAPRLRRAHRLPDARLRGRSEKHLAGYPKTAAGALADRRVPRAGAGLQRARAAAILVAVASRAAADGRSADEICADTARCRGTRWRLPTCRSALPERRRRFIDRDGGVQPLGPPRAELHDRLRPARRTTSAAGRVRWRSATAPACRAHGRRAGETWPRSRNGSIATSTSRSTTIHPCPPTAVPRGAAAHHRGVVGRRRRRAVRRLSELPTPGASARACAGCCRPAGARGLEVASGTCSHEGIRAGACSSNTACSRPQMLADMLCIVASDRAAAPSGARAIWPRRSTTTIAPVAGGGCAGRCTGRRGRARQRDAPARFRAHAARRHAGQGRSRQHGGGPRGAADVPAPRRHGAAAASSRADAGLGRAAKIALRDAVRPWLPDALLDRRKQGFALPLPAGSARPARRSGRASASTRAARWASGSTWTR